MVWYSAGWYYSSRSFAGPYLRRIADENKTLLEAADLYDQVAYQLSIPWNEFKNGNKPDNSKYPYIAQAIREAGKLEETAVNLLDTWLKNN